MRGIRGKIDLYIVSLGLLFVFFIILTTELPASPCRLSDGACRWDLVRRNVLPLASLVALLYCVLAYLRFDWSLRGATEIPFEIDKLEGINYEHLTFLATYVVPLISFDFGSGRQLVVLGLLLVVMGAIYIKTDLFYANPSLALLGFHIYRAEGHFKNGKREGIVLVCRGRLTVGQQVRYIRLDDRIYYVGKRT